MKTKFQVTVEFIAGGSWKSEYPKDTSINNLILRWEEIGIRVDTSQSGDSFNYYPWHAVHHIKVKEIPDEES